jgi:hypothetical protein
MPVLLLRYQPEEEFLLEWFASTLPYLESQYGLQVCWYIKDLLWVASAYVCWIFSKGRRRNKVLKS